MERPRQLLGATGVVAGRASDGGGVVLPAASVDPTLHALGLALGPVLGPSLAGSALLLAGEGGRPPHGAVGDDRGAADGVGLGLVHDRFACRAWGWAWAC